MDSHLPRNNNIVPHTTTNSTPNILVSESSLHEPHHHYIMLPPNDGHSNLLPMPDMSMMGNINYDGSGMNIPPHEVVRIQEPIVHNNHHHHQPHLINSHMMIAPTPIEPTTLHPPTADQVTGNTTEVGGVLPLSTTEEMNRILRIIDIDKAEVGSTDTAMFYSRHEVLAQKQYELIHNEIANCELNKSKEGINLHFMNLSGLTLAIDALSWNGWMEYSGVFKAQMILKSLGKLWIKLQEVEVSSLGVRDDTHSYLMQVLESMAMRYSNSKFALDFKFFVVRRRKRNAEGVVVSSQDMQPKRKRIKKPIGFRKGSLSQPALDKLENFINMRKLEYKERSVRAIQIRCQTLNATGGEPIQWYNLGEEGELNAGWPLERVLVVSGHYTLHDLARLTAFVTSWEDPDHSSRLGFKCKAGRGNSTIAELPIYFSIDTNLLTPISLNDPIPTSHMSTHTAHSLSHYHPIHHIESAPAIPPFTHHHSAVPEPLPVVSTVPYHLSQSTDITIIPVVSDTDLRSNHYSPPAAPTLVLSDLSSSSSIHSTLPQGQNCVKVTCTKHAGGDPFASWDCIKVCHVLCEKGEQCIIHFGSGRILRLIVDGYVSQKKENLPRIVGAKNLKQGEQSINPSGNKTNDKFLDHLNWMMGGERKHPRGGLNLKHDSGNRTPTLGEVQDLFKLHRRKPLFE